MATVKLAIIGGGPGGYVAAIRAAQLGADVALIEKNKLGGTCLNVGCIPTKALLHAAALLAEARNAGTYGAQLDVKSVNWNTVQAKKEAITNQLVSGVTGLMKSSKVKVLNGTASFASTNSLRIAKPDGSSETLNFDRIIIASGSIPVMPPIPGVKDNPACVDSTGALSLKAIPARMLVIGGGVIGVELATAYHTFGTKVTIVEAMPNILPLMDGELAAMVRKNMEKRGIKILTSVKVMAVKKSNDCAAVEIDAGGKPDTLEADVVLVAVGRRTDTESLGLDKAGIAHDRGRITVNEHMRTNLPHVYAIGDCLGQVMLAHIASAQGEIAAENAMGHNAAYNGSSNPSCVYTNPEFAGVGITEEQAKERKLHYIAGKFPLMANGKALIMNGGEGLIKIIAGKEYNEILGVHILGPRATDLIAEGALAIGLEATMEDIMATIHAHPTVGEAVREAVMAADKRAIHIPNK
jgi:dihydrolipoamide dehydrogenase